MNSKLKMQGKLDILRKHTVEAFIAILFIVMFFLAHMRLQATLIDDAYITYRYAANLAQGNGLVYNVGERVLGTTTPGYALLLGGLAKLVGVAQLPSIARVINVVSLLVAGTSAGFVAMRITRQALVGSIILGLVLLSPQTLFASLAGMESSLFLSLLCVSFLAMTTHRWLLSALTLGLSILVRPEGIFVAGLFVGTLIIIHLTRNQGYIPGASSLREFVLIIVVFSFPVFVWAMISLLYYGTLVPQSIVAKIAGLYPLAYTDSLNALVKGASQSLFSFQVSILAGRRDLLLICVGSLLLGLGGIWIARRHLFFWIIPVSMFILMGFYATSRTLILPHYFAHFEIFMLVCWWAGLYALGDTFLGRWKTRAPQLHVIVSAIVLFPSVLLYPWESVWKGSPVIDNRIFFQDLERQPQYRDLALQIKPYLPLGTVVLMPEIGELGFYLDDVKVLDACGLVSPEAVPYFPVIANQRPGPTVGVIPPGLVRDYVPDLVIFMEIFGRKGVLDDPWFSSNYTPVIVRQGRWLPWGSQALYVFSRIDFQPGVRLRNLVY